MKRLTALAACWLLAAASGGAATISLELDSSLLFVGPGQSAVFSGTVANTGGATAYITGDSFNFPYTIDDAPFFLTVPPALPPGGSASGPLFTAIIPVSAPLGLNVGSFSVLGGDEPGADDLLATATFAVQVVPEPGTVSMLVAALLLAAGSRFRR